MKKLPEGTCGFVREADYGFNYACEICAAKLEHQGKPVSGAPPADYEFISDSREHIFLCGECFQHIFNPLK